MIRVQAGKEFEAVLWGAEPGLVGTIGFEVLDPPDDVVIAESLLDIEESSVVPGTYTARRIAPLSPPATGEILLGVWLHSGVDPDPIEEIEVRVGPAPVVDSIVPELAEVAVLLRARTKDENGNELGTFTSETRPTATQVEALIQHSLADLTRAIASEIPDVLKASARSLIAMRAAQKIELSYYPEQTAADSTVYQTLRLTYESELERLIAAVQIRDLFGETRPGSTVIVP
jgi:hypothetical protein